MVNAEAKVKTPTFPSSGFTLLELMIVLLLLGMLVGVGLTVDFGGSPSSQRAVAAQLAEQIRLASLEAVQSGTSFGLDFVEGVANDGKFAQGYRWLRYDGKRWQLAEPALLDAKYAEFRLPDALTWQLRIDGTELHPQLPQPLQLAGGAANPRLQPSIVLQPSRAMTPFALAICEHDAQSCNATLVVDALGRVEQRDDDATR
jgi:prepilin-type N-terminal cleavage/methylation domain-containing protein